MEMLDVIDEKDNVVGQMAHADINKKLLPHRIVHVLIFNKKGNMLLQKRSANKSFCPLHWSTAVGGHVQSGENYKEAAQREFVEELGVIVPVKFMFKIKYQDPRGFFMLLGIFKATYEGKFEINTQEVESVKYFSKKELESMIANGELFHPELKFLLEKHEKEIFAN
jgi:isopentenyl-diphosphate delta-isomerase type 1